MRLDSFTNTELTMATVAVWVAFTAVVGFMDDRNQILGSPSKAHAALGDQGESGKGQMKRINWREGRLPWAACVCVSSTASVGSRPLST